MEQIGNLFNTTILGPILNLLILIYKMLESINMPGALGFAIVVLTVAIRLLIWPTTKAQLKSAQKMMELKPLLDQLKEKHKADKMALQRSQMQLYKEHNINPAAGCLPILIQFPLFIGLYQSIINMFPTAGGGNLDFINALLYHPWLQLNKIPDPNFFGLNLALKPSDATVMLFFVPLVTAVLTFVQSKMMMPKSMKHYKADTPKETKEKESMEDMMGAMQGQMVYLMPVMIGYFAFQFPVGLAIYWNTFTILGIIQQYRISGWGGAGDLIGKIKVGSRSPR